MELETMEIGLVFWAEQGARAALRELEGFGLRAGQLGVPPGMACDERAVSEWREALGEYPVALSSAVCAYAGEDYASLDEVHRTVGFTAPGYAAERIGRTEEVARFASALGIRAVSCHIGFIPADASSPVYQDLLTIARQVCDFCATLGQDFVLETGQESAATLLSFLGDAARPNLRVNFDPANMILYGSGDPMEALHLLQAHIRSVHCKDGRSPARAGEMGQECALGEGEVDFPAFLALLRHMDYRGLLAIEREHADAPQRAEDIRKAIVRLREWKQQPD